jgi:hypothetical protein
MSPERESAMKSRRRRKGDLRKGRGRTARETGERESRERSGSGVISAV